MAPYGSVATGGAGLAASRMQPDADERTCQTVEARYQQGVTGVRREWHKMRSPAVHLASTAFSESTNIQNEAANRPMSLRRNWPGATVIAGSPSSGTITPGVENMKLTVVRKSPAERRPPAAENTGKTALRAISSPILSSSAPRKA